MSNWSKILQYLQNTRDEVLRKTTASEDLFFLYSQRQLEKKALSAVIKKKKKKKKTYHSINSNHSTYHSLVGFKICV